MMAYRLKNDIDDDEDDEGETKEKPVVDVETQEIIKILRHVVSRDPLAADLQLSLFASAVFSNRSAWVAQPLPPEYDRPGGARQLAEALDAAPALRLLVQLSPEVASAGPAALRLLSWLLSPAPPPPPASSDHWPCATLRALPRPASGPNGPAPSHLFEVLNPYIFKRWRKVARGKKIVSGFIGQPLDSFFSMVHCGLRPGQSIIKIRRNLQSALRDSPVGYGLGSSELGARLRCVAECQCVVEVPGLSAASDGGDGDGDDDLHLVLHDGRLARATRLYVFNGAAQYWPSAALGAASTKKSLAPTPLERRSSEQEEHGEQRAAHPPVKLPEFRFEVETASSTPADAGQEKSFDETTETPRSPPEVEMSEPPSPPHSPSVSASPNEQDSDLVPVPKTDNMSESEAEQLDITHPHAPRPADSTTEETPVLQEMTKSPMEKFSPEEFARKSSGQGEDIRSWMKQYKQGFDPDNRFTPNELGDVGQEMRDSMMNQCTARSMFLNHVSWTNYADLEMKSVSAHEGPSTSEEGSQESEEKEYINSEMEQIPMDSLHTFQMLMLSAEVKDARSETARNSSYCQLLKSSQGESVVKPEMPRILVDSLSARFPDSDITNCKNDSFTILSQDKVNSEHQVRTFLEVPEDAQGSSLSSRNARYGGKRYLKGLVAIFFCVAAVLSCFYGDITESYEALLGHIEQTDFFNTSN